MLPPENNITDAEIIEELGNLKFVNRSKGRRSPHKPLMVLSALGKVARQEPRFMAYTEIYTPFNKLIRDFTMAQNRAGYPFVHLESNIIPRTQAHIWEIQDRENWPSEREAIREHSFLYPNNVHAGFTQPVYDKLRGNTELILKTAQTLLNKEFPESMHDDILKAVGLDQLITEHIEVPRIMRDPNFRTNVLRAYASSCAICDFDARLDDTILGVEAAHIQWHAYNGPSEIGNGLALCTLHHKAFDRGAVAIDDNMKVLISEQLSGGRKTREQHFYQYEDKQIYLPRKSKNHPQPEYLQWHRKQVFKG